MDNGRGGAGRPVSAVAYGAGGAGGRERPMAEDCRGFGWRGGAVFVREDGRRARGGRSRAVAIGWQSLCNHSRAKEGGNECDTNDWWMHCSSCEACFIERAYAVGVGLQQFC